MIYMVMPTTIQSFSPLYAATTLGAIIARLNRATAIRDATRQALVVNHDCHFDDIEWEEDRYLPRHWSGQSTCNIAAPLGEENFRFRPTLEGLAQTNTDLGQTLEELDAMGKAHL